MTPLNQPDDITVVTSPDFAAPRGGSVIAIFGGNDFPYQDILSELTNQWPTDDALTVYIQPIVNGDDLVRAKAIFYISTKIILVADDMNPNLSLMLTMLDEDCVFLSNDKQWNDNAAYFGLNSADSAEVAVHFLASSAKTSSN